MVLCSALFRGSDDLVLCSLGLVSPGPCGLSAGNPLVNYFELTSGLNVNDDLHQF